MKISAPKLRSSPSPLRKRKEWRGPTRYWPPSQTRDRFFVYTQMASILRINMPLAGGLNAAAMDAPNSRVEAVMMTLYEKISAGASVAEAMAPLSLFFPPRSVDLVRAGEDSGQILQSFDTLLDEQTRELDRKKAVTGYLFYLGTVSIVHAFLLTFMIVKVIPVFVELLEGLGAETPWALNVLHRIAEHLAPFLRVLFPEFLEEMGPIPSVFIMGPFYILVAFFVYLILTRSKILHDILVWPCLFIPPLRAIVQRHNLALAAATMAKLLGAGMPLLEVLRGAAALHMSPVFKRGFARIAHRVHQGTDFAEALNAESFILPSSFRSLMSLGARSGDLAGTCEKISEVYERDVYRMRSILADSLVPIVLFIIGLSTLLAVLSVYGSVIAIIESLIDSL